MCISFCDAGNWYCHLRFANLCHINITVKVLLRSSRHSRVHLKFHLISFNVSVTWTLYNGKVFFITTLNIDLYRVQTCAFIYILKRKNDCAQAMTATTTHIEEREARPVEICNLTIFKF